MKYYIKILLVIIIFFIFLYKKYNIEKTFDNLYDKLMNDFDLIFPDKNRNSGGAQFFHHILQNIKPNYDNFIEYNKYYCAISGSPIDPKRENRYANIVIKDINNNLYYGKQYICCSPCICDLIRSSKVEKYEYKNKNLMVFTINDPCKFEKNIPEQVTSFRCNNKKTVNASKTKSGNIIIGILHDSEPYDENNNKHILAKKNIEKMCKQRNSTPVNELFGGMGDIFVKLANVENQESLKNIYGETLQPCKLNKIKNNQGSWDKKGYCSELDGGVHQICMNVNRETSDFSTETGQSDWSQDRVGNNHCMCLGAWALYKAKNKGTDDELVCESIPDIALSSEYINNWNTWNGNELPNQIIEGVDSLVQQCYYKRPTKHLKERYDKLRSEYGDWKSII